MRPSRRLAFTLASILALGGLSGLAACKSGGAGAPASVHETASDMPVGSPDAKVVLVEYASITCPHCANFHNNVLPELKTKYIDTGKVRYVFREFPTPPIELASAGHLLARCAGADKREGVVNALMRQQMEIYGQSQGPGGAKPALLAIAASAGMSEAQFDACMGNREILETLVKVRDDGVKAGVTGTPSFFINGDRFEPPVGREVSAADLSAALDAALAKAK